MLLEIASAVDLKHNLPPNLRRTVAVLFLALQVTLGVLQVLTYRSYRPGGSDHFIYTIAVQRAWGGGNPYEPHQIGWGYFYPPASLLLLRAVDLLSPKGLPAWQLWTWLGAASTVAAVLLLSGMSSKRRNWWAGMLLLTSAGSIESIYVGQINGFVVLLVAAFWCAWQAKRPLLAGSLLAGAVALKATPLVFVVLLLRDRDWRSLAALGIASVVLLVAAESLIPGPWLLPEYLSAMRWAADQFVYLATNYSLSAIVPVLSETWFHVALNWRLVHWIKLAMLASLLAVTVLVHGRRIRNRDPAGIVFVVCNVVMVLAPNLLWLHHEALLIPAYWWLLTAVPRPAVTILTVGSLLGFQSLRALYSRWAVAPTLPGFAAQVLLLAACLVVLASGIQRKEQT
jgi:hypothetical protein